MNEAFLEAASHIRNRWVEEWKRDGGKVIGHVCSQVPEEVLTAAGMLPYRLRGIETDSTAIGDTYFGPFICSCPKAILENAGRGRYAFLDGAVMVQSCDSMRRLDECWRKASEDYGGTLPSYFHYLGLPHKVSPYSIAWFAEEIERFARSLEDWFEVKVSEDALGRAIEVHNRTRELLRQLDEQREREDPPLTGTEAMAILLAGTAIPKAAYNDLLEKTLGELADGSGRRGGPKKRILLVGSVVDDLALVRIIEGEGAIVVADTACFGSRTSSGLVSGEPSPWKRLAERYLDRQLCPRMFGYYKDRLALIREKIQRARVEGVVLQNIRFCDLHGSENGLLERALESEGVACIRIEREYGALADEGRIRMRVAAFLERIS